MARFELTANTTLYAQWTESKFQVTTTDMAAGTEFKFYMSAKGTFYVDWGDGNVKTITRTNTTDTE